jgi:hypothetical protein
MRYYIAFLLLLSGVYASAQQVKVAGTFSHPEGNYFGCQIILNDTLMRFSKRCLQKPEPDSVGTKEFMEKFEQYNALHRDTTQLTHADAQGRVFLLI